MNLEQVMEHKKTKSVFKNKYNPLGSHTQKFGNYGFSNI